MRKKILIMHPDLVCGGAEKVLIEMLRTLDVQKFDVTLLLRNRAIWDNRIPAWIETHYMMHQNPMHSGHIIARLYKYIMIFLPSVLFFFRGVHKKFDLAIAYHEPMIWFLPCVKARRISWVHSDYSHRNYPPEVKSMANKTGWLAKTIIKRRKALLQHCDRIIVVAKSLIDPYVQKNEVDESKIKVCYNISNDREIQTLSNEPITDREWTNYQGNHLVIVGRIHHEKAMHRLVPLMKHICESHIDANIYIVGDGNERASLEKLITENKMDDKIIILGYRDNPYKYIKHAKLLLCCSPAEAYCTTTKESIILGTPFVTTLCSGMKEQIGNSMAGIIAPNGDDTLAPHVIKVLTDDALYAKMKEDVKVRKRALACENAIKAIEEMLLEC